MPRWKCNVKLGSLFWDDLFVRFNQPKWLGASWEAHHHVKISQSTTIYKNMSRVLINAMKYRVFLNVLKKKKIIEVIINS